VNNHNAKLRMQRAEHMKSEVERTEEHYERRIAELEGQIALLVAEKAELEAFVYGLADAVRERAR
jgi:hypothetical protein